MHIIKYNNGHYVPKLPLQDDHPVLPMNYEICKKCTDNTIHRLSKEPELLDKYGLITEDKLKRGFIEKVDSTIKHHKPIMV